MNELHRVSYSKCYKPKDKKQYLPEYLIWILEHRGDPNKKCTNYRTMCNCKCQFKNVGFLSYKNVGNHTFLYDIFCFSFPLPYIGVDPLFYRMDH